MFLWRGILKCQQMCVVNLWHTLCVLLIFLHAGTLLLHKSFICMAVGLALLWLLFPLNSATQPRFLGKGFFWRDDKIRWLPKPNLCRQHYILVQWFYWVLAFSAANRTQQIPLNWMDLRRVDSERKEVEVLLLLLKFQCWVSLHGIHFLR